MKLLRGGADKCGCGFRAFDRYVGGERWEGGKMCALDVLELKICS